MGVSIGSRRGMQSSINVTPLVDVVLVLLIIFMVVTPLMRAAKLELPVSRSQDHAPPSALTLSLTADRELRWEQTTIPLAELAPRLRAAGTGTVLTLKADASLPVEAVQPVLDALQQAGATGVRFAVEAPKQ